MCVVLKYMFTLCLLVRALQGCQGFGRKAQESEHPGLSDTSGKYEQRKREREVIKAGKKKYSTSTCKLKLPREMRNKQNLHLFTYI